MFALIGNFDFTEILVIAAVSLMVFGKRLPEVAMNGARQFMRLRRSISKMWREAGLEDELRRVRREVESEVPRFQAPHLAVKEASRRYMRDLERDVEGSGDSGASPASSGRTSGEVTPETVESPVGNPALDAARRGPDPEPTPPSTGAGSTPVYAPRPVSGAVVSPGDDRREDVVAPAAAEMDTAVDSGGETRVPDAHPDDSASDAGESSEVERR